MRRVSSTLIPRTPDGCRILCSHFCCPAPRPRGLNSGTEKALIQLQNRDFVILGQNLPDFCHRLGDARSEPGMTGRRFRVKPGMTMRSPIWSGMTSGAGRSRSFAVLRMTGSGQQNVSCQQSRERRGPSALPEHDYFDFREQIPAFLLPAVHRSRPAPRVPKSVPLEAKQGVKCSYRDKNRDAGSGSAPAKPFTRTGSGVSKAKPDSGAGAAAVPATITSR